MGLEEKKVNRVSRTVVNMWRLQTSLGLLILLAAFTVLEVQAEECRWSKSEKLILGREAGNQGKFRLIGALNVCGKSSASKGDKRTADDALRILGVDEVWLAGKVEADAEWSRLREEAAQQRAAEEQLRLEEENRLAAERELAEKQRVEEERRQQEKIRDEIRQAFERKDKALAEIPKLRAANEHLRAAELLKDVAAADLLGARGAVQVTQVNTELTNKLLELLIEQGDKQIRQNEQIIELLEGMQSN
jgi:hypothetical protein